MPSTTRMPDTRLADAETAVLIISHRGANPQIESLAQDDQAHGATIITLTSSPQSNLARIADILLLTDSPNNHYRKSLDILAARALQITCIYVMASTMRKQMQKQ